jgi:hypothetical protein
LGPSNTASAGPLPAKVAKYKGTGSIDEAANFTHCHSTVAKQSLPRNAAAPCPRIDVFVRLFAYWIPCPWWCWSLYLSSQGPRAHRRPRDLLTMTDLLRRHRRSPSRPDHASGPLRPPPNLGDRRDIDGASAGVVLRDRTSSLWLLFLQAGTHRRPTSPPAANEVGPFLPVWRQTLPSPKIFRTSRAHRSIRLCTRLTGANREPRAVPCFAGIVGSRNLAESQTLGLVIELRLCTGLGLRAPSNPRPFPRCRKHAAATKGSNAPRSYGPTRRHPCSRNFRPLIRNGRLFGRRLT